MNRSASSYTWRTALFTLAIAWCTFLSSTSRTQLFAQAAEAELEFNYLPIAHVRTDPIISDTCLSDHVHTFYGPPLVSPSVTTEDLLATDLSEHSGLVEENKSLYWHPSIYRVSSDGVFTLDDIYYASVYYFWDTRSRKQTQAFPKGFRMIASDRAAFTECVVGNFKPCTRPDGCAIPEGVTTFFPSQACDMLEITMDFPSCWDGRLDSPNHKNHMAYPDEEDDSCKAPHNKQVATLSISIYIKNYDGGYHTWSDMSDQFHTDYLAGWDVDLMQTFLEGCKTDTDNCDRFLSWKGGEATGCDSHDEKHDKLVQFLPPLPDTMNIANEPVTNIASLPRGLCQGPFPDGDSSPTPGPLPTKRPTEPPSKAASCKDNPSFRFKNKRKQNCAWVGKVPNKRCNFRWKQKRLKEYCPEACNECKDGDGGGGGDDDDDDEEDEDNNGVCKDDPNFQFRNDKTKHCDWVSRNPSNRCRKNWRQRKVREYCPEACDECQ